MEMLAEFAKRQPESGQDREVNASGTETFTARQESLNVAYNRLRDPHRTGHFVMLFGLSYRFW